MTLIALPLDSSASACATGPAGAALRGSEVDPNPIVKECIQRMIGVNPSLAAQVTQWVDREVLVGVMVRKIGDRRMVPVGELTKSRVVGPPHREWNAKIIRVCGVQR